MNGSDYGARAFEEINRAKPHLAGFFHIAMQCVTRLGGGADALSVECVKKLALASENLYFDVETLAPGIIARGELALFSNLLFTLSHLDLGVANFLLARYPSFGFPLGKIAPGLESFAASSAGKVRKIEAALAAVFSAGDADRTGFVLSQFALVARHSPGTLAESMALFEAKAAEQPWERLEEWLMRSTDLLTSGRTDEGVQNLLLRTRASRMLMGVNSVVLDDLKGVIKIYSASLCGYDMTISGQDTSLYGLKCPYTDGASIFLPPEIGFFKEPVYNERVYTALAAEQAASVLMGSFTLDLDKVGFMLELRERYALSLPKIADNVRKQYAGTAQSVRERADGELEVVFQSDKRLLVLNTEHEKLFYSFPTPDFAKELFTLIENARIEFRLGRLYPGLKEDFSLLNAYLWKLRPPVRLERGADREAQFMAAVECLIQFSMTGKYRAELDLPSFPPVLSAILSEFGKILRPEAAVQDTAAVLFSVYNLFYDNFPIVTYCSKNDIRESFSGSPKPDFFPEIVGDASPELLKERQQGPELTDGETKKDKAIDLTSLREAEKKQDRLRQAIADGTTRVFRYPEYDCVRNAYEKNHCSLFESALPSAESDFYEQVIRAYPLVHKRIKKRFLQMKPEELEMSRRWLSGDEINLSDALDYTISLARGESLDEKIYFRKIMNTRDVDVSILFDASSSTDTMVGKSRVIDIEKAALSLLASALDLIGDEFGIFAFHSAGRHRVFVDVIKDFNEPWGRTAQGRIASVKPQASNRDGCAIRHMTAKLQGREAKTRLLILLSDGIPADAGYGSASAADTSRYAIEDTRRAILEARRLGIIPYCLTIDRFAKKYVPYLYGEHHHAVLSDVGKLPEKLSQLYLRLTR
jgi:nitric oxide reductase NorD protein